MAERVTEILARLRRDIAGAETAARVAVGGVPDGGSFCRDAVFLHVGSDCLFKRKSKAVTVACGGSYIRTRMWRGYLLDVGRNHGQAMRRTVGVEAATKYLRERGWSVDTFYAVD